MLTVHIEHDGDIETPCDNDGWKLYSFNSSHPNYKIWDEEEGKEANRKHEVGLLFYLWYFEHGQSAWGLMDKPTPAGVEFQWDGRQNAGYMVWEGGDDIGSKTKEDRLKDAGNFLEVYNSWANGEGLYYRIEDEDGETVDSCGGFYGCDSKYMMQEIARALSGREFIVRGDVNYLESELRIVVAARNEWEMDR